MQSLRRLTSAVAAGLLLLGVVATPVAAKPAPGTPSRGFRLFARSLGALTVNRVYCGLASNGNICTDSTNSSTIGGGFWPKGTADQYVFNSGLQIAGVIQGAKPTNPWGGDISGALFFNARGGGNGEEVQPIYNSTNASDAAAWPDAAKVPTEVVASQNLFNPLLRGRTAASQGDVWWLSWDGNPDLNASRDHPLGVLVEQRGMGWNFPSGNEDIIYFIYTFYNVTSTDPAVYANVRPEMRPILLQKAQDFQNRNNAKFGITLPAGGYTIDPLYAAFGADMDVGTADVNYSSVNLPFALGYTYEHTFTSAEGWTFDPKIFSGNFFPGIGFVGVKYLRSPTGPGAIQLFSNTQNNRAGAVFFDPKDVQQLYRYLSGNLDNAQDGSCNFAANPGQPSTHICFVAPAASDSRFFQSSTALTLPPGGFGSIVVAYIFAPPTKVASFVPGPGVDQKAGNPRFLTDVAHLTSLGANMIDSLTGFKGYSDGPPNGNGDGIAQQGEFTVVQGSLLGKAKVAQDIFDNGFLLPFAPEPPDFFLVPGNNQVTVIWRPSPTETIGDPFFSVASQATVIDPVTGLPTANSLYDPNYRQFDVEGYRVYRGRVDSPNSLQLVAQFDYAGTTIKDFAGQVNPLPGCAPEIQIIDDCGGNFDDPFPVPGTLTQARTNFVEIPLVGEIVQAKLLGSRVAARGNFVDSIMVIDSITDPTAPDTTFQKRFLSGIALLSSSDTAVTGGATGFPRLADTGVPFAFVDKNVRNNFRYFYSVTAFDINSYQSGPSNLESARITKSVTPSAAGSNVVSQGSTTFTFLGRKPVTDTILQKVDAVKGTFDKPAPRANGWDFRLGSVVSQVLAQPFDLTVTLDSLQLGDISKGVPSTYFVSLTSPGTTAKLQFPVLQDAFDADVTSENTFVAVRADQTLAKAFGGDSTFSLPGVLNLTLPGAYWVAAYGRGCANSLLGTSTKCDYNGARWFDGPSPAKNEVAADPVGGNRHNAPPVLTNYNNAGTLTGVAVVHEPRAYLTLPNVWRNVEYALAGAARAADFNVYWGAAGKIDSVIDVSNDVVVPFSDHMGGTWGILNQAAAAAPGSFDGQTNLSIADFGCVVPFNTLGGPQGQIPCTAATPYLLSQVAVPGPVFEFSSLVTNAKVVTPASPNLGFAMYLAGHLFMFELTGGALPAPGTVWTMRSYSGFMNGGNGAAGAEGPYKFTAAVRPMTAVGAQLKYSVAITNKVLAAADSDLSKVHTVPDPYYVTNEFESTTDTKIIKFVNLPKQAIIRIYSSSGVLVALLEHNSSTGGDSETWNVRNRNNQVVASGVYFYHVESGDARKVGRFTVVNFAQ